MKVINKIKMRLLITLKLFSLSINYLFRYLSKQTNKHKQIMRNLLLVIIASVLLTSCTKNVIKDVTVDVVENGQYLGQPAFAIHAEYTPLPNQRLFFRGMANPILRPQPFNIIFCLKNFPLAV